MAWLPGSTGEAAALDEAEQLRGARRRAGGGWRAARGNMGLAGNHQGHVLRRLARLGERPLAGVLAPAPSITYGLFDMRASYFPRTGRRLGRRSSCTTFRIARAHSWAPPPCWRWPSIQTSPPSGLRRLGEQDAGLDRPAAWRSQGRRPAGAGPLCLGGTGVDRCRRPCTAGLVRDVRAVRAAATEWAQRLFLALAPIVQLFARRNQTPQKALKPTQGAYATDTPYAAGC